MNQNNFKPPYVRKERLEAKLQRRGLRTPCIEKALKYAERAHRSQKRDRGNPYLEEHIYPIAAGILDRYKDDLDLESILILGILHDVLEDDPTVSLEDVKKDFGDKILADLLLVTKKPEENNNKLSEDKKRSINIKLLKKLESSGRIPQIIKLEDRFNNLSSFEATDRPKYKRCVEEVKNLFIPFAEKTNPLYKKLFLEQLRRLTPTRADQGNPEVDPK